MPAKHLFFDFDGVLCDSLTACIAECERLRRERYPALPPLSPDSGMDMFFAGPLRTSLHRWLSSDESKAFFDEHSAAMAARAADLLPFPGIRAMLERLPPRSASIVSSAYNEAIRRILGDDQGALPASIAYLKGRDTREPKDVKIKAVLDVLEIESGEAVYVGDLESDYLYCNALPLPCILVTYGYQSRDHLR